jgi:hypothetical protein
VPFDPSKSAVRIIPAIQNLKSLLSDRQKQPARKRSFSDIQGFAAWDNTHFLSLFSKSNKVPQLLKLKSEVDHIEKPKLIELKEFLVYFVASPKNLYYEASVLVILLIFEVFHCDPTWNVG